MKITADTNVLLRLILADDETQSLIAVETMERANLVAVTFLFTLFVYALPSPFGITW